MNDSAPTPADEFKPLQIVWNEAEIIRLWLKALLLHPEVTEGPLRDLYIEALLNFYHKFINLPWNKT